MSSLPTNSRRLAFCYFLSFATIGLGFVLSSGWASLISISVILGLALFTFGEKWKESLGLQISFSKITWFVLTFLVALFIVLVAVNQLKDQGIQSGTIGTSSLAILFLIILLQSFCEEVLFRCYLLKKFLLKKIDNQLVCVCLISIVFALAHLVNYRVGDGVFLSPKSLLTLFFLSAAGSFVFLRQGHILSCWGFHAGWNFARFAFEYSQNGARLNEAASFNALEGSTICLVASFLVCAASVYPADAAKARR